jgi:hypothetical protein
MTSSARLRALWRQSPCPSQNTGVRPQVSFDRDVLLNWNLLCITGAYLAHRISGLSLSSALSSRSSNSGTLVDSDTQSQSTGDAISIFSSDDSESVVFNDEEEDAIVGFQLHARAEGGNGDDKA